MSEKSTANNDNQVDHKAPAPKPVKREEPALRWPSASTSAGGAYIPNQGNVASNSES